MPSHGLLQSAIMLRHAFLKLVFAAFAFGESATVPLILEGNAPLRCYHARGSGRLSDAHSYAQVSRFLTPEVRALMDSAYAASPGMVAVDQFVASLWQEEP